MKISLVKDTTSTTKLQAVEEVLSKLYPNIEVQSKKNFYASELGDFVIKLSEAYDKDPRKLAEKVIEITGLGVSTKILNRLGE